MTEKQSGACNDTKQGIFGRVSSHLSAGAAVASGGRGAGGQRGQGQGAGGRGQGRGQGGRGQGGRGRESVRVLGRMLLLLPSQPPACVHRGRISEGLIAKYNQASIGRSTSTRN